MSVVDSARLPRPHKLRAVALFYVFIQFSVLVMFGGHALTVGFRRLLADIHPSCFVSGRPQHYTAGIAARRNGVIFIRVGVYVKCVCVVYVCQSPNRENLKIVCRPSHFHVVEFADFRGGIFAPTRHSTYMLCYKTLIHMHNMCISILPYSNVSIWWLPPSTVAHHLRWIGSLIEPLTLQFLHKLKIVKMQFECTTEI